MAASDEKVEEAEEEKKPKAAETTDTKEKDKLIDKDNDPNDKTPGGWYFACCCCCPCFTCCSKGGCKKYPPITGCCLNKRLCCLNAQSNCFGVKMEPSRRTRCVMAITAAILILLLVLVLIAAIAGITHVSHDSKGVMTVVCISASSGGGGERLAKLLMWDIREVDTSMSHAVISDPARINLQMEFPFNATAAIPVTLMSPDQQVWRMASNATLLSGTPCVDGLTFVVVTPDRQEEALNLLGPALEQTMAGQLTLDFL